jgi:peptide/nickel transport system ATP-binding protein
MSAPLLDIAGVSKRFARRIRLSERIAARLGARIERRAVRAVENVTLSISAGETVALVGESGCGKTTLGRIAAGILVPSAGLVRLDGAPVAAPGGRKLTTKIQTVFQDPFASLNPRLRVGEMIAEGPRTHDFVAGGEAKAYVARWLARVGLDAEVAERYPHQFSGGQRQRIAIARALAMRPDVLICDEPVASLDVSIQAQILNLFLELRRDLGLTCLFISHDLGVVRHVSDRIAIMYLGRIVELGPTEHVFRAPSHPYTRALLAAVPRLAARSGGRAAFRPIAGELPSPLAPPPGCAFHPRCPIAVERCRSEPPSLRQIAPTVEAACHLVEAPLSLEPAA